MSPFLVPVIQGAIELILGKIQDGKPVDAKEVVETIAPKVEQLEQVITETAKETWLADLHNGGWMATSWRPLAAISSIGGLLWEAVALPVLNTILQAFSSASIPYPPEYISQAFLITLLTLIGARGIEKINIARRR